MRTKPGRAIKLAVIVEAVKDNIGASRGYVSEEGAKELRPEFR